MAFTMTLWNVEAGKLQEVPKQKLEDEKRLEDWIEQDASLLGMDLLIIGRQVQTPGRRIDLLAIDQDGSTVIIELKRDKSSRDIVAQVLDYASWVNGLTPQEIDDIASSYLNKPLADAFRDRFDMTLPENIGSDHRMVIVASELDDSSERIVQYLSSVHSVDINVVFFTCFQLNGMELVGRSWLLDPEDVEERSESRRKAHWSGFWFVNVGDGEYRSWDDCKKYGFLSAGGGSKFSDQMKRLQVDAKVFAYISKRGYVGFGRVSQEAVMARDFVVDGNRLLDLVQPELKMNVNADNPELSDWVVGVQWEKVYPREEPKWFSGAFANPNVVCKIRDARTVEFLRKEFAVEEE
ncbi:MAG: DUF91 domain-containing protein [Planctomycetes bacterium]|nr:DUF91 domain-containing protein [Planctomycetota bacterium]MBU4397852.1 DUF91 domain-containing protein [Planctomycetota bacterium]MCG2682782.1 endonuclease NucS [Planctomycetales bacterium]